MDHQDKQTLFTFPNYLQTDVKIVGFPIDEILPSILLFLMLFNINRLVAVAVCIGFFLTIRSLKVRHGPKFIIHFLHWYGDDTANKTIFKRTPSATKKYWIY
ncbi:putative conjugative transfer protein TraL [Vibrionales bacterium SWAT-3]|nr:putative conjugative transfer protein TraL [Vibrionales bacterium SWAT-3]